MNCKQHHCQPAQGTATFQTTSSQKLAISDKGDEKKENALHNSLNPIFLLCWQTKSAPGLQRRKIRNLILDQPEKSHPQKSNGSLSVFFYLTRDTDRQTDRQASGQWLRGRKEGRRKRSSSYSLRAENFLFFIWLRGGGEKEDERWVSVSEKEDRKEIKKEKVKLSQDTFNWGRQFSSSVASAVSKRETRAGKLLKPEYGMKLDLQLALSPGS